MEISVQKHGRAQPQITCVLHDLGLYTTYNSEKSRLRNRRNRKEAVTKMREWIYRAIYWISEVHDHILGLNDQGGWYFNDKQLHFIVIGVVGMLGIFICYPLFKLLAKYGHTMVIAFMYVFTMVLVITFAIEIGQWYSGTGRMDSEDMAYGIAGFLIMFLIFAFIRGLVLAIHGLLKKDEEREEERRQLAAKH